MRISLLAFLLSGCGTFAVDLPFFAPDDEEPPPEPWVEVGESVETGFGELIGDETFTMYMGPDGGWYFVVAGIAHNVPEVIDVGSRVRRIATNEQLGNTIDFPIGALLAPYDRVAASGVFREYLVYLDANAVWDIHCDLPGEEVEICLAVTDPDTLEFGEGCAVVVVEQDPRDAGCP